MALSKDRFELFPPILFSYRPLRSPGIFSERRTINLTKTNSSLINYPPFVSLPHLPPELPLVFETRPLARFCRALELPFLFQPTFRKATTGFMVPATQPLETQACLPSTPPLFPLRCGHRAPTRARTFDFRMACRTVPFLARSEQPCPRRGSVSTRPTHSISDHSCGTNKKNSLFFLFQEPPVSLELDPP